MDWTAILAGIDFTDSLGGVSQAALALIGLAIAVKGAGIVIGFLKR
jgi:hypothetical protein